MMKDSLDVQSNGTFKGFITVSFNGAPGGSLGAVCSSSNSWSWPVIDQISILGVGPIINGSLCAKARRLHQHILTKLLKTHQ